VTNISNIAVERDFYAIHTEAGISQDIERRLAAIDGEACAAMERIGSGAWPPNDHDHDIIANFIALQITRGQDFRELQTEIANDMMRFAARAQAAFPEGIRQILGEEVTDEAISEVTRVLAEGQFTVTPDKSASIVEALTIAANLVQPIGSMDWALIELPGPGFLTSDAPVRMWRRREGPHDVWGTGVVTAQEISLPLDPQRCLLLQPPDYETPLKDMSIRDAVLTLNMRTASGAHRYFFSRPAAAA